MHVTGDRTAEHGLSTVGYDDEGVAAQSWDLVKDGVLVGYQLDRAMARLKGSAGPTAAPSPTRPSHVPIQRMANVSLQPAAGGPSTEELIGGVERGIYVVGDKCWSIDMQRYNFQFTGQRFYRIENGRLAGQLRDVAYQATTTDFWGSMEAVGGPQTYVLGGAFNCGKGQPGQVAAVSHGCPTALFRGVHILNTVAGGRPMSTPVTVRPQEIVERALALQQRRRLRRARRGDQRGQPALGRQHADHQRRHPRPPADRHRDGRRQRGHRRRRRLAQQRRPRPARGARRAAEEAARAAGAAEDAAPLVAGTADDPGLGRRAGRDARSTSSRDVRARARRGVRPPPGPRAATCSASPSTSSPRPTSARPTGLRLPARPADRPGRAHRQVAAPTDPLDLGRRAAPATSADVDVAALDAELTRRLGWAERRIELPRRALRDDAAAERGRRPDDLPVLVVGRPRRQRRPDGLQPAGRRHPGRRAADRACRCACGATPRAGASSARRSCWRAASGRVAVGLRQRAAARGDRLDPRRRAHRRCSRPGTRPR